MQSHPEIPGKTANLNLKQGAQSGQYHHPNWNRGDIDLDLSYQTAVKTDIWSSDEYQCGVVAVPIRQLRDAAYRNPLQLIQKGYRRHLPQQLRHPLLQQIRQQRHLKGHQTVLSRIPLKAGKEAIRIIEVCILLGSLVSLAKHQFGNYVIQCLMQKISSASRCSLKGRFK